MADSDTIATDALDELADEFAEAQREAFRRGYRRGLNDAREMDDLVEWLHDQRDAAFDEYRNTDDDDAECRAVGRYRAYVDVLEQLSERGVEI